MDRGLQLVPRTSFFTARARSHQISVSSGQNKASFLQWISSSSSKITDEAAAGRQSISWRRPAAATDPMKSSSDIIIDTPFFRIYGDRRIDRLVGTATVPPGLDAATGVTSRDVVIDAATGLYVRLYLPPPPAGDEQKRKKLPVLVYFHGGAFVTQSAAAPAYQPFLSTLAARAGLLAVSVNYRLAPEHPLPAAYEDSLTALRWVAAAEDPWLSEHGDVSRLFVAGESAGGNIAHNVAVMAGAAGDGALRIEGAALLHAGFSGRETLDGEPPEWVETMEKLWAAADGVDDPRMNPLAPAAKAASLRNVMLACERVLVCAAEKDLGTARCRAYYEALAAAAADAIITAAVAAGRRSRWWWSGSSPRARIMSSSSPSLIAMTPSRSWTGSSPSSPPAADLISEYLAVRKFF